VKRERLSSAEDEGSTSNVGPSRSPRQVRSSQRVKVEERDEEASSVAESVVFVRTGDPDIEYLLDNVFMLVVHCGEIENHESNGPATGSRWSNKLRNRFLESLASRAEHHEMKDLTETSYGYDAGDGQTERMAAYHVQRVQDMVEEIAAEQSQQVILVGWGMACLTNLFALSCYEGLEEKIACVVNIAPDPECVQMILGEPDSLLFSLACPMLFVTGGKGTAPVRALIKKLQCPTRHLVIKETNENLYGPKGTGVNMEKVSERIVSSIITRVSVMHELGRMQEDGM